MEFGDRWIDLMRFCIVVVTLPLFSMTLMLDFFYSEEDRDGATLSPPFLLWLWTLAELNQLKGFKISDNVGDSVNLSHILYVDDTLNFCDVVKEQIL